MTDAARLDASVLIVDDQAPFRAAARAVVARVAGLTLVGEAMSGEEAVEVAERTRPDLVLMDINLGGMNGLEATRRILGSLPATRVVLLSTYREDELPAEARTCGAVAYVNKDELSPRRLRDVWASTS
jgi:two-component system invasion response regulator UvrY